MPVNRNALIRFKTIDLCLQNRYRRWTLEDLIEACSNALYEYEGIEKGVSKRTVQMDIQIMRSDKLGYNAPIVVTEKKYYSYEETDYSIMNIPISEGDLNKLTETVDFLKQFKGFSHFRELDSIVQKLEDHIYSQKVNRKPVIDFEKNEDLKGIEYLEKLYKAIISRNIIEITYQSFNARQPGTFKFYPYLLKEFRNRWFVLGTKTNTQPLLILAIDRIVDVRSTEKFFSENIGFDATAYFKDVIGVTVNHGCAPEKVILFVTRKHAPYVLTKPFHSSQKLIEQNGYGITISLEVQHNFELEKEILALGDGIVVLAPDRLRANITDRISNALDLYNTSITEKGFETLTRKFSHNGFCTINQLYPRRSINQLCKELNRSNSLGVASEMPKVIDLEADKIVKSILMTPSLEKLLGQISNHYSINQITYYDAIPGRFSEFMQSGNSANLELIVLLSQSGSEDFRWLVIPGSHKKPHSDSEKTYIVQNCNPVDCHLNLGGAIIFNSGIIKRFPLCSRDKAFKFLIMEYGFCTPDQDDPDTLPIQT